MSASPMHRPLDPDTGSIDVGSTTLNGTVFVLDEGTAFVG